VVVDEIAAHPKFAIGHSGRAPAAFQIGIGISHHVDVGLLVGVLVVVAPGPANLVAASILDLHMVVAPDEVDMRGSWDADKGSLLAAGLAPDFLVFKRHLGWSPAKVPRRDDAPSMDADESSRRPPQEAKEITVT